MRWTKIDETTLPDHFYLGATDECYYLREYFVRGGYQAGETNQLILNLKIKPSAIALKTGRSYYKEQAIARIAGELRASIPQTAAESVTWVPIPPSKVHGHPDYDDRLVRTLQRAFQGYYVDIRQLLRQTESTEADHASGNRMDDSALRDVLVVDSAELAARLPRGRIILFDDVLTTGKHFKCCEHRLRQLLPDGQPILGMFIARAVRPNPFDEFEGFSTQ